MNKEHVRSLLIKCNLKSLFIDELGWDHYGTALDLPLPKGSVQVQALAQKRGMSVWHCPATTEGHLPDSSMRRKIENLLSKSAHENLIVFTDSVKETQIWHWVRREAGKPATPREHVYHASQPGDALIEKLEHISFSLDEENDLTLTDVTRRARAGFDVERVTKRFFDRFQKEHAAFLKLISGIPVPSDCEWYASVMLNRLMFVYFIQRKGFLDGDRDYLSNRLKQCQKEHGKDAFYSFYRFFLLRLFHEGLGNQLRSPTLEKLIGRIPYLNGGLFDVHELEKPDRYGADIHIPDNAFEAIFSYFDQYQWNLDERPLKADNEINPDVLGYIFEKYINQKQMGAYYTKEDITEYISKNTVVPFLFDSARVACKIAFENKDGPTVWDALKEDPDRYLYAAVRYGTDQDLPPDIAAGINPPSLHNTVGDGPVETLELRKNWNKPAPTEYALPTETWREHIVRRTRYQETKAKLAAGEVRDINDLITLNLDIRQFAQDTVANSEGPELLRAFWNAIEKVTILDPTCGSGAFLFAALNILEPLYEACLDRMEAFVSDIDHYADFRSILEHVASHPNRRYFILKSIILNNLYGVDIMEEAVEICKLRLFLKLVSQVEPDPACMNLGIEPLPDIDFNIRTGNTLVGYANYAEVEKAVTSGFDFDNAMDKIAVKAADLQQAFDLFRHLQTEGNRPMTNADKKGLRTRLNALKAELDTHLASDYGISPIDKAAFGAWLKSHQPFHWFIEFYGIIEKGGFDVIIGNPPYVEYSKVRKEYVLGSIYSTLPCGNIFAYIIERSYSLARQRGRTGLIVPLSLICTSRTNKLREVINIYPYWIASYDMRPSSLFEGVAQRLSILLGSKVVTNEKKKMLGGYRRWTAEEREGLISLIQYIKYEATVSSIIPKFINNIEVDVFKKITAPPLEYFSRDTGKIIYVHRIVRYFVKALDFLPIFIDALGNKGKSEDYKEFFFESTEQHQIAALLNSTLFYWYWRSHCDGFHCGFNDVFGMPFLSIRNDDNRQRLFELYSNLMTELRQSSVLKKINTKPGHITYQEFYPGPTKPIIDEIDTVLAKHYGFTEEELDFIINYDIKYRMGRVEEGDEE